MTPDEHQRERITTWRLAYNGECAQDPEDRARAAECALAEFDKRFPAPSDAAPVEPETDRERRENLHCVISDLADQCREANAELAALRQKARLWDAVASGKVVLLYDDRELFAGRYDKEDSIGWQTGWFNTAEEAVEAAIAAGALK